MSKKISQYLSLYKSFLALLACCFSGVITAQTFPGGGFKLPPGKSISIIYDVDVTNAICEGGNINNQATISGSNFSNLLTDDPDLMGASDPTLTLSAVAFSVNAGSDTTICGSNPGFQLNGIVSGSVTTGKWSGGSGSFTPNDSTLNPVYTFSTADTMAGFVDLILTADDPNDGCPPIMDTIRINLDPPSLVYAGPDQFICASDTIMFMAELSGLGTNLVWQKNAAFGTFVGPDTDPNAKYVLNATGMALSSLKFGVMSNDPGANVCQGGLDTVEIFISPKAIVDAGPDRRICGSQDTLQLNASIGGAATTAIWSGGSGMFSPSINVLNPVYTFSAADSAAGVVNLILTTNDPMGLCGPVIDTVRVQLDPPSVVYAGPDQFICASDTIMFMAELSGVATNLVWQKNAAFGTFVGPDTDPNAKYVLNATGMALSSLKFGVMSNDPGANVCQGGLDTVGIFISPKAIVDAGPDRRICGSEDTIQLNASIGGAATSASWSGGSGMFSPSANVLNPVYTFSAADSAAGFVNLILTTDDPMGLCGPVMDTVRVQLDTPSVVYAGPDQFICTSDTIMLMAELSGVATNLVWQKNAAFGTFVGSDTQPIAKYVLNATGMALSSISFGVMSNDPGNNVCQGGLDTVIIYLDQTAVVNAGIDEDIPEESINYQLNGMISGAINTGFWTGGSGSFVPNNQNLDAIYVFSESDRIAGQVTFVLTSDDPIGMCRPVSDTLVVNLLGLEDLIDTPTKTLVSTSDSMTSDVENGTVGFPRPLAIGEKVKFRLYSPLSESTTISYQIKDFLLPGFEFVPGSALVSYVADVNPSMHGDFAGIQNSAVPNLIFENSRITISGNEVTFDFGSIINNDGDADNEIIIIDFEAIVLNLPTTSSGGIFFNSFETVIDEGLPTESFASSNIIFMTIVEPALNVSKTFSNDLSVRGNATSFTIDVMNLASDGSTAAIYNVLLEDLLDSWMNLDSFSVSFNANATNSGSDFINNTVVLPGFGMSQQDDLSLLINHLPLDGAVSVMVYVSIDPNADPLLIPRNIINLVQVSGQSAPGPLDLNFIRTYGDSDEDDLVIVKPTLLVGKSDELDPGIIGSAFSYTIIIENSGSPDFDATNVILTDILPGSFVFDSAFTTQGTCLEAAGEVTCMLDTIASGELVTVTVYGYFPGSTPNGTIVNNIAYVTSREGNHGNDGNDTPSDFDDERAEEPTTLTRVSDLQVDIYEASDPVYAGCDVQTYMVCVKNNGPSDASNISVAVDIEFPVGVVLSPDPTTPPGNYEFMLASLPSGDSVCWMIEAEVGLGAIAGSEISIEANVSADETDLIFDNNFDAEMTTIIMRDFSGSYFVDSSNTNVIQDGASWETAFNDLQDALHLACIGDTVHVAQGTYFPDNGAVEIPGNRDHFYELKGGVTYLGGYPSGGVGPRNPSCNPTILSGDINMDGDSTGNTYNVIKTIGYDDTIYFDGFIVEHGNAIPNGEEGGAWWDGSFFDSALLEIRNTTFRNNYATLGGAFYGEGSRNLKIIHSIFHDNTSITRGGAMYLTPDNEGGIAEVLLENDLFYNNNAPVNGGAIAVTSTIGINLNVINSTISKNSPDGINYNSAGLVNILNTIIWDNGSASVTGMNPPNVQNSIIEFGGGMGVNNKDEDPQFQDPGLNDFRLSEGSPAIDMGDNGFVGTTEDLDGLPRITNGTVDIGAYEFLLNCDTVVLYVNADGSVPGVPVDSFLMAGLDSNCMLVVNGEVVTEMATFSCDDTSSNVSVQIVKTFCATADTIYSCIKQVIIVDTFPKHLSGIDALNLSLDEMCMGVVTADMVLSGIQGCRNAFEITLEYPEGTNVYEPANKVDQSHVGHCITFKATLLADGNSTWGTICIEDKLGPTITMLPDTMIFCVESSLPSRTGTATATDCGGVETLDYRDHIEDYKCGPENDIAQIITRVWTAIDGMGNIATDTQIITVKYLPDSLLHAPEPLVTLSCGDDISPAAIAAKLGDQYGYAYYIDPVNQIISPIKDGVVCNFAVSYEDGKKIEVCEEGCTSSYK
ncbi:MAG: hypothetical protein KDC49_22080, partial [Saprospiraceae bacterium]|nr:hypothetical protein [Saprospiraceae bacterium]